MRTAARLSQRSLTVMLVQSRPRAICKDTRVVVFVPPMTNAVLTLLSAEALREHYASGHWRDDTIYSLVRAHARRAGEKFAVRDRHRRLTYGALLAAADALAADLARHGVRPGERVSAWIPGRVATAIALVACSRNGTVYCPSMHRDHTAADIVALLARTRSAAFIGEAGYGADAERNDVFARLGEVGSLRRVHRLAPRDGAA